MAVDNGIITDASQIEWIHHNNETFNCSLSDLIRADYTFVVLRDPLTRLASCYLNTIVDETDIAHNFSGLSATPVNLSSLTFRQFAFGLESRIDGDIHWRPQVSFLVYKDYDDYFCTEAFEEMTSELKKRIDLDVLDARGITKHGTDQYRSFDNWKSFSDVPAGEIRTLKRFGLIPRYEQMYDPTLVEHVKQLYRDDVELYRSKIGRPMLF